AQVTQICTFETSRRLLSQQLVVLVCEQPPGRRTESLSPRRYWVVVSALSAVLRSLPVPKNTHTSPTSSKVTVGLEVIGPRYFKPAVIVNVSSISVGTRFAPEAMPQVEVEQAAALHVPIVRRYILPVQYPIPLEAGSI